jgi:hypothetical protein
MNKNLEQLLMLRKSTAKTLSKQGKIIKGSFVILRRTCGKKNCKCYKKGELHTSLYLSQSHKGKTRMIYIPKKHEKEVKEYAKNHKLVLKSLEELSEINLKIIKDFRGGG